LTPYEQLGGEAVLRRLVARFYAEMDSVPEAAGIRALHARELAPMEQKLFEFLSGWLGGPSLYIPKYGHPMMRARHLPFPIGISERDQWLYCMRLALTEVVDDPVFREQLFLAFARFADHMRNKPETEADE
jgi:hemoglobin